MGEQLGPDGHRRVEEALRESEARFDALVQNTLDIVVVTEADGTIRKIDKSFIKELTAIVSAIVDLAHILGMKAVAEGVENDDRQATRLRDMGCNLGQGYHVAEPLPPEVEPRFLLGSPVHTGGRGRSEAE